jgi:hypothetical protein
VVLPIVGQNGRTFGNESTTGSRSSGCCASIDERDKQSANNNNTDEVSISTAFVVLMIHQLPHQTWETNDDDASLATAA